MRQHIIDGYANEAGYLVDAFESFSTEQVLATVIDLLPTPCRALDLGAGTGRDAAWLTARGFAVTAVEPTAPLREAGQRLHAAHRIAWVDDALPALASLAGQSDPSDRFGLVMLIGVWQHVAPDERVAAWQRIAGLAAPKARIVMSVRHGPGAPGREVFSADDDQTIAQAIDAGFGLRACRYAESVQAGNRAAGVRWTWLVFDRAAA